MEPNAQPGIPNPAIVNATAHFYYNWDINSTLIDYVDTCLPGLLPVRSSPVALR